MPFSELSFEAARLEGVAVLPNARAAELIFGGVRKHDADGSFSLKVRFAEVAHVTGLLDLVRLDMMGGEGNVAGVSEDESDGRLRWRFPLTAGCLMIEGAGVVVERV
ncbi:hypothetical protein ACQ5SO_12835 [Rhodovulum sp. DZ06]|uniref:hypothetical protein n=1 Tax=Rhodovulum sp. DZ06 TaxID=3425126 RepID=UPI003D32CFD3